MEKYILGWDASGREITVETVKNEGLHIFDTICTWTPGGRESYKMFQDMAAERERTEVNRMRINLGMEPLH
jgi:hypothetical protein